MMCPEDWTVLMAKVELTVAWIELEGLHTEALIIARPVRGNRMWKAMRQANLLGVSRPLSLSAKGALNAAVKGKKPTDEVTVRDVEKARALLVDVRIAFGHEVFA